MSPDKPGDTATVLDPAPAPKSGRIPTHGYLVRAGSSGYVYQDPSAAQRCARTTGGVVKGIELVKWLDEDARRRFAEKGELSIQLPEEMRMIEDTFENRIEFVKSELKADPEIPAKEIKRKGAEAGLNIYPLIIGKAKTALGLSKPRSATRRLSQGSVPRRASPDLPSANALVQFAREFEDLKTEVQKYRVTIARIREALSQL